jgi:membrane-associated protease RseP (regulator of RpoE activity)
MDDALRRGWPAVERPRRPLPILNVVLFVLTVATAVNQGRFGQDLPPGEVTAWALIRLGLPFAAALIAILLTHEMGHYLFARIHRVACTLPYFIPVPFGIGTFGAVIRMRGAMPDRKAVLDIGAAGPIAGFLVAVPLYAWGIAHSTIHTGAIPMVGAAPNSPYALLLAWLHGLPLGGGSPQAGELGFMSLGDSLVTWAVQAIVLPDLPEGASVMQHPVATAAWFGLFVTALNLIPLGQLDGGHVVYAAFGRRGAVHFSRAVSLGLLLCGIFLSWNWLVWFLLTRFLIGLKHPPAVVEEPLGPGRRAVAWASLAIFAATFIPVPISLQ